MLSGAAKAVRSMVISLLGAIYVENGKVTFGMTVFETVTSICGAAGVPRDVSV
jgi:hypothetical protein